MISQYKYTDKEINEILSSIVVLLDSRERVNDHILQWFDSKKIKYKIKKLDQGDYSCYIPQNKELNIDRDLYFDKDICIERKGSLDELAGNFSQERDRIKNEFLQYPGKMTLLIEDSTYSDICKGNYKSQYAAKSFLGTIHSFRDRYDIPFIFVSKEHSPMFIYYTLYYFIRNILN